MKNRYTAAAIFLLLISMASCKKKADIALEKAENKLLGKWTIDNINVRMTDTLGLEKLDTNYTGQGTLEFLHGDANSTKAFAEGFFNEVHFTGSCITSELVSYFKSSAAGDAIIGGWALLWDADPAGKRIQFWGVTGGGSMHRSINITEGSGERELFYVLEDINSNTRAFYTWKIHKL